MPRDYVPHGVIRSEYEGHWGSLYHGEVVTEWHQNDEGQIEWTHSIHYIREDGGRSDNTLSDEEREWIEKDKRMYNWNEIDARKQISIMHDQHSKMVRFRIA